jgi:hydrogenase nickel incorporation protein HypA/HybF
MHEFSVAIGMLEAIGETLGGPRPLAGATVVVGPLSGVNPEALRFAFPEAAEQEGYGRPELTVREVPARLCCRTCGAFYETADLMAVCPLCNGLAREVQAGEECYVESVDVVETAT